MTPAVSERDECGACGHGRRAHERSPGVPADCQGIVGTVFDNRCGCRAFRPKKRHVLKCHAENFDAIASGLKRFEVRHEEDRTFAVGDVLELIRTDVNGVPTTPPKWTDVDVLWLTRHAGPLTLLGADVEGERAPKPLVVMSIKGRKS